MPHIHEKKTAFETYDTILKLYQSTSDTRKLALKEKLRSIQTSKDEPIATYLSRFTQVQDELGGVDVIVYDHNLVSFALLRLHKSWKGSRMLLVGERTFQIGKGFGLTACKKRSKEEP